MTSVPQAAVDAAAASIYGAYGGKLRYADATAEVQAQYREQALLTLEAALPHLRPLFETASKVALELGRKEALDQKCGCILGPVHPLGEHLHLGATTEIGTKEARP